MEPLEQRSPTLVGDRFATGLRALRLVTVFAVLLDLVSGVIAQAYGVTGLGSSGPLAFIELALVVAGVIAVLWQRHRLAVAISLTAAVLFCAGVVTGADVWLVVVIGVMAAATARPRRLVWVTAGLAAYAVAFGIGAEYRHPGWGWSSSLNVLGGSAAAVGVGLIARALLRAQDARTARVREYGRQNEQIRAEERARLAEDLETIVTDGIANVQQQIDSLPPTATAVELRQMLTRVDQRSRLLLTELRTLLEVLRREPAAEPPGPDEHGSRNRRPIELLTARHVRVAAAAILLLLAVRDVLGHSGGFADPDLLVRVLGLLACAVAVWRPMVGAAAAAATLALAMVLRPVHPWDAIAVILFGVISTARVGARRIYLVLVPLIGYALIVTAAENSGPIRLAILGYAIVVAVVVGLAARHFHDVRRTADRQLGVLADERDHIETDERTAVARELHDVVAHQLSLSTLHIMATSLSEDAVTLAATAAQVRRSTLAAQDELVTLLHAMRGPESNRSRPAPLVAPTRCAAALVGRLAENGFALAVDIDPAADHLDAATQRTISRIMQEGATNILRYAPPRARCQCTVALEPGHVSMTITSPLGSPQSRSHLSLGWGLRGIRERVDLTHGTFSAGPNRTHWVIHVTLPQTAGVDEVAGPPVVRSPAAAMSAPTRSAAALRPTS